MRKNFRQHIDFFNFFNDLYSLTFYDVHDKVVDIYVSSSIEQFFGYTKEEFESTESNIVHISAEQRKSFIANLKKQKKLTKQILTLKKKNGDLIFAESNAELIYDDLPKGVSYAIKVVFKDITDYYKEKIRLEITHLITKRTQRRLIDWNKIGEFIYQILKKSVYLSNFFIAIHEKKTNETIFHFYIDDIDPLPKGKSKFSITYHSSGFTEHLISLGKEVIAQKNEVVAFIKKNKINLRGNIPEHIVSVPIKIEGENIGVVVAQSYLKDSNIPQGDIELLQFIAAQLANVIQRKNWQEKLIEKEKFFRSLIENSSEIIGIVTSEGVIEYISNSCSKITGIEPFKLIGVNIVKEINKEEEFKAIVENKEQHQLDKTFMINVLHKNRQKRYLDVSIGFLDEKNKELRIVFNAKDVTDKITAEKKQDVLWKKLTILHQIERTLIDSKPLKEVLTNTLKFLINDVFDVDRASIYVFNYTNNTSQVFALETKYKSNIHLRKGNEIPFLDLRSYKNTIKNKITSVDDITKCDKKYLSDKLLIKEKLFSYYVKPIVINNKIIGSLNFSAKEKNLFRNINETIIDEITLLIAVVLNDGLIKKHLSDLHYALDNAAMVYYTDYDGKITYVNNLLLQNSGFSHQEMIGRIPTIFRLNGQKNEYWKKVQDKIKQGNSWQGELKKRTKEEKVYWVFETITPIFNDKKSIEGFISVQFDITEEKLNEKKLIREVIEAQEKERERFAMEIHDGLGQLLLATKMNMNVLQKGISSLNQETQNIYNNSMNLINNSILEARTISHGLMTRVLKTYGVIYAVEDMINSINKTVSINFKLIENIKGKRFDLEFEMGIYRTLQELTNNIIKHSQATKAKISLLADDKYLRISVLDDGVGISDEMLSSSSKKGIGLKNMKSRIKYLEGDFIINSTPKKGTEISINIELTQ